MRAAVTVLAILVGSSAVVVRARAQGSPPTSPFLVYDVTNTAFAGGASPGGSCSQNRAAINEALLTASEAHGGTVYLPPGEYCVDDEILGYAGVTLSGAGMAAFNALAPTRIATTGDFGANKAVIRVADQGGSNYGFEVENIGVKILSTNFGITGVDFTGVWYGAIRGVSVNASISGHPGHPLSPGSIGFLFNDHYSPQQLASACFGNLVERTTAAGVETAYRFDSAGGNTTLITMTNFWASDIMTGIWTSSVGGVGLTFRDGYLGGTLGIPGQQAFKHTSAFGLAGAAIVIMNVQSEGFDVPSDVPLQLGQLSNIGGDLYIGGNITGGQGMTTPGPISGASLSVTGNVSSGGSLSVTGNVSSGGDISGHNLSLSPNIYARADVSARSFTPSLQAAGGGGYECGARADCPCSAPTPGLWGGTMYPPPPTQSFWASIYHGTTLYPGANTFRYYTGYALAYDIVLPDVFFTFHPKHAGGINQVFQMSGTNTKDFPYGYWVQAYDVTIFVSEQVTLTSGFVFFLEANQTNDERPGPACPNPPTLPG